MTKNAVPNNPLTAIAFGSPGVKKGRADFRLDGGQDVAIDVVEKVDSEEQGKRAVGAGFQIINQRGRTSDLVGSPCPGWPA